MQKEKKQTVRILDSFVTVIVVLVAATLVASGIAISKVNTEYMTTGVKAAKIVAERDNEEISISMSDKLILSEHDNFSIGDKILSLLPPPINTAYLAVKEIKSAVLEKE
jgi:hypothetical protein